MSDVLSKLASIINEVTGVDQSTIVLGKHLFDDLGIDSLDFLDVVFDIDQAFGLKLPMDEWLSRVEENAASGRAIFTVDFLVDHIQQQAASI